MEYSREATLSTIYNFTTNNLKCTIESEEGEFDFFATGVFCDPVNDLYKFTQKLCFQITDKRMIKKLIPKAAKTIIRENICLSIFNTILLMNKC